MRHHIQYPIVDPDTGHITDAIVAFLFQAGALAQKRLARGVKLNVTEATALIGTSGAKKRKSPRKQVLPGLLPMRLFCPIRTATVLQERIRDGAHSVSQLMQHGKTLLGRRHVLPGVPELLREWCSSKWPYVYGTDSFYLSSPRFDVIFSWLCGDLCV